MDDRYFSGNQNAEARLGEIAYLLQAGKKIDAIKLYRQVTGASLTEAKAAIEHMEMSGSPGMVNPQPWSMPRASAAEASIPDELLAEVTYLIAQNKKIQAIKLYRQYTGMDLANAKNAIDRIDQLMRAQGL